MIGNEEWLKVQVPVITKLCDFWQVAYPLSKHFIFFICIVVYWYLNDSCCESEINYY